jgi:hypothetical protein
MTRPKMWEASIILGAIFVFVIMFTVFGHCDQIPQYCTPGDFSAAYSNGSLQCVAKDVWATSTSDCDVEATTDKHGWVGGGSAANQSTQTWMPDCAWAFQDKKNQWHCPYETATGRVVACAPCEKRHAKDEQCAIWYNRCLKRVAVMKTHKTVEASSISPPKDQETDHSTHYHWACPNGYAMDYLGKHDEWDSPICVK